MLSALVLQGNLSQESWFEFIAWSFEFSYFSEHCNIFWLVWILVDMGFDSGTMLETMNTLSTSDHSSVVSITLFVTLLCACIVIGHLLEENRWMNESITALIIVSTCIILFTCAKCICCWPSVSWSIYLVLYACFYDLSLLLLF